eukprot:1885987-Rhodomonas_salina.1
MSGTDVGSAGAARLSATLENGKRTSHVGTPCYLAPEVMNHEVLYATAVLEILERFVVPYARTVPCSAQSKPRNR